MTALTDYVTAIFKPQRSIGYLVAQVTIEETAQDDLTITQHPIEFGAAITDHAFKQPPLVTINAMWSNSGIGAVLNTAQTALAAYEGTAGGGYNYIREVYEQLQTLQSSRILLDISTGKRSYSNMLIRSMIQRTDYTTENSLAVTLICQQCIIVQTTASTLPPKENMVAPQKTTGITNAGTKVPTLAIPTSGGAFPIQ